MLPPLQPKTAASGSSSHQCAPPCLLLATGFNVVKRLGQRRSGVVVAVDAEQGRHISHQLCTAAGGPGELLVLTVQAGEG